MSVPPELKSGGQLTHEADPEPGLLTPTCPDPSHTHTGARTYTVISLPPHPTPGVRFRLARAPSLRSARRPSQSGCLRPAQPSPATSLQSEVNRQGWEAKCVGAEGARGGCSRNGAACDVKPPREHSSPCVQGGTGDQRPPNSEVTWQLCQQKESPTQVPTARGRHHGPDLRQGAGFCAWGPPPPLLFIGMQGADPGQSVRRAGATEKLPRVLRGTGWLGVVWPGRPHLHSA